MLWTGYRGGQGYGCGLKHLISPVLRASGITKGASFFFCSFYSGVIGILCGLVHSTQMRACKHLMSHGAQMMAQQGLKKINSAVQIFCCTMSPLGALATLTASPLPLPQIKHPTSTIQIQADFWHMPCTAGALAHLPSA
jgi:hypothetical protein